jgi:prenyltransferase beta subunit
MSEAASRSAGVLADRLDCIVSFVEGCRRPDGGFRGRGADSDLYYTAFATGCLVAAGAPLGRQHALRYLRAFGAGARLDLVHLACLITCRDDVGEPASPEMAASLAGGIERHRSADGGYCQLPGAAVGTAYGCFLAIAAYQDLGLEPPDTSAVAACLRTLRSADGGYGNFAGAKVGSALATAAAVVAMQAVGEPVDRRAVEWLLDQHSPAGGFRPSPQSPQPDLLSTATALHALDKLHADLASVAGPCRQLVEGLWSDRGGFAANAEDREIDCEYTFYGMLALGSLARA